MHFAGQTKEPQNVIYFNIGIIEQNAHVYVAFCILKKYSMIRSFQFWKITTKQRVSSLKMENNSVHNIWNYILLWYMCMILNEIDILYNSHRGSFNSRFGFSSIWIKWFICLKKVFKLISSSESRLEHKFWNPASTTPKSSHV